MTATPTPVDTAAIAERNEAYMLAEAERIHREYGMAATKQGFDLAKEHPVVVYGKFWVQRSFASVYASALEADNARLQAEVAALTARAEDA